MTAWTTLGHLTSLQSLDVDAREWQLGADVALPASLTRLHISRHGAEEMPAQVRQGRWAVFMVHAGQAACGRAAGINKSLQAPSLPRSGVAADFGMCRAC